MAKTIVNAKEILADIRGGMNSRDLMEKYRLSEKDLEIVFKKLLDLGVLKQREPEKRPSETAKGIEVAWKCPACGKPQVRQFDECPDCGVIVAKFKQALAKGEIHNVQYVWQCSHCGKHQPRPFGQCPECSAVGSRIKTPKTPEGREKI